MELEVKAVEHWVGSFRRTKLTRPLPIKDGGVFRAVEDVTLHDGGGWRSVGSASSLCARLPGRCCA
jgi:hypothetical protein